MTVGATTPEGGTIVAEHGFDAQGNSVPVDDPSVRSIEVEVRTPSGETERVYLERPA